ncbi:hypothetical protein MXM51_01720 [Pantoea stewartii]|uniref:hypothetical protein n=1 Tax=Pantoea stewartii TaxID=66269 RepID=UPI002DBD2B91|nr:hypothetical protein [Pantoea stewartii]MEB6533268.1 hypothetical protein [Pantoea stewartii]
MEKVTPFRIVDNEAPDPTIERRKELCRAVLNDMLAKVDEEDLQTICFVGVTANGDIVRGRSVETDYISVLGALEQQKYVINQLLDNVNINSSEQEY